MKIIQKLFLITFFLTTNSKALTEVVPSHFVTIGYKYGTKKINHNEQSSSGSFAPLSREISIIENGLEIGYLKEFFAASPFSFSILANAGYDIGRKKGISAQSLSYEEKLSGHHYSIGGGIHINFEILQIKTQPYIFTTFTAGKNKLKLNYSHLENINSTVIEYRVNNRANNIGAGMRFIDTEKRLLSYIAIAHAYKTKTETTESSAVLNATPVPLSVLSGVETKPFTAMIGLGIYF